MDRATSILKAMDRDTSILKAMDRDTSILKAMDRDTSIPAKNIKNLNKINHRIIQNLSKI
jgi:hypothetical protein